MKGENVVIRADTSTQIDTGHVMRCLAIAQAWEDVGKHAIGTTDAGDPKVDPESLMLKVIQVLQKVNGKRQKNYPSGGGRQSQDENFKDNC